MSSPYQQWLCVMAVIALPWIALIPGRARALDLLWSAPAACADESAARERIVQTLGPRGNDPSIAVEARVTTDGKEWLLSVRLTSPQATDTRTLRAASCEPLLEGVAVIVAALLPSGALAPENTPPMRLSMDGSLAAVGEHGALPRPSAGIALGLVLMVNAWHLGLAATAFVPRDAHAPGVENARAQVSVWTASINTCRDLPLKRLSLSPCLWFEAGQVSAREHGLAGGGDGSAPWMAPGVSLSLRLKLSEHWTLSTEAQAFLPLRLAQIYIGPPGSEVLVHEPLPVSFRAGLKLSLRLWDNF